MKPVFVIDFDDTLTAFPEMWREAIRVLKGQGVRVICMTQRTENESNATEIDEWMEDNGIMLSVYFTNGQSKIDRLRELNIEKFILCDDNPNRAVSGV